MSSSEPVPVAASTPLSQFFSTDVVTPQSTMLNGSVTTSGGVPRAGGGDHSWNFFMTPLRHSISFCQ